MTAETIHYAAVHQKSKPVAALTLTCVVFSLFEFIISRLAKNSYIVDDSLGRHKKL